MMLNDNRKSDTPRFNFIESVLHTVERDDLQAVILDALDRARRTRKTDHRAFSNLHIPEDPQKRVRLAHSITTLLTQNNTRDLS